MILWIVLVLMASSMQSTLKAETCSDFVESTACGGNVIGDSGIIRYQHSGYGDNRGCLWLIRSNLNSQVEVRLLENTLSSKEFINVYTLYLDGEIGGNSNTFIKYGDFATRRFDGPIILVSFSSLSSNPSGNVSAPVPGFTMLYRGCGPDVPNSPTFSHFYREKIPGEIEVVKYPEEGLYPNNQIITYLGQREDRAILNNGIGDWKVKVTFQDIQTSNYCLFADSLTFSNGALHSLCAVDDQDEFIWRFCQRNETKEYILPMKSSKYSNIFPDYIGILAIFSSDRSQQGKGFVFEW